MENNIHVVASDLSKWKKKHPRVFFGHKQIERQKKSIHVLSSNINN
jgi:hypothetical protein